MEELFTWLCSLNTSEIISLFGIVLPIIASVLFFWQKYRMLTNFQKEIKDHEVALTTKMELLKIQYGNLFSKRIEIIQQIYNYLLDSKQHYISQERLRELIGDNGINTNNLSPVKETEIYKLFDLLKNSERELKDFKKYFVKNKLYFTHGLSGKIMSVIIVIDAIYKNNLLIMSNDLLKSMVGSIMQDKINNSLSVYNMPTLDLIDLILKEIEVDFRSLIGVNN